ncbi:MAG: hypothetical protein JOZ53_10080, partial [Planctomycetaceae bacterium]|nr:hypothetical protein [Planctomycetaceae bacterium]
MFVTEAAPKQGRNGALILKHLDELRRRLRRYRKMETRTKRGLRGCILDLIGVGL